jgi:hypothetical protein
MLVPPSKQGYPTAPRNFHWTGYKQVPAQPLHLHQGLHLRSLIIAIEFSALSLPYAFFSDKCSLHVALLSITENRLGAHMCRTGMPQLASTLYK